jgi:hypothetical protein
MVPGTRLRADIEVRLGGVLSVVVAPFVQRRMAKQLEEELELLRSLCETSDPGPAAARPAGAGPDPGHTESPRIAVHPPDPLPLQDVPVRDPPRRVSRTG